MRSINEVSHDPAVKDQQRVHREHFTLCYVPTPPPNPPQFSRIFHPYLNQVSLSYWLAVPLGAVRYADKYNKYSISFQNAVDDIEHFILSGRFKAAYTGSLLVSQADLFDLTAMDINSLPVYQVENAWLDLVVRRVRSNPIVRHSQSQHSQQED